MGQRPQARLLSLLYNLICLIPRTSLEILKDWIGLIDEDGWVAREQILGEEARSKVSSVLSPISVQLITFLNKVPPEFHTQIPNYANPPTLTMAVTAFIRRVKANGRGISDQELGMDAGCQVLFEAPPIAIENRHLEDPELALSFLKDIYKPLKRHFEWFRRTQRGQIKQYGRKARSRTEGYRWRGRSEQHVLTSGMDDYPRGSAHTGELHLDLISWMAFFSRTMREISSFIGETDDEVTYGRIEEAILENIEGNNFLSLAVPMLIPCSL